MGSDGLPAGWLDALVIRQAVSRQAGGSETAEGWIEAKGKAGRKVFQPIMGEAEARSYFEHLLTTFAGPATAGGTDVVVPR